MRFLIPLALLCLLATACSSGPSSPDPMPTIAASVTPAAPPTPEPSPTPVVVRQDIQATRLVIPGVNIDSLVGESQQVPYVDQPLPGCPPNPDAETTFTLPNQGIVTPDEAVEGLENKSWIFGHSRWANVPGIFFAIQDVQVGDELFLDGRDRASGVELTGKRYVVNGLYLTDTISGGELLQAAGPEQIPTKPTVILQTSVRESGPGKPWILDQPKLLAKATNLIEGDINDPCKYLLLFVVATADG